MGNCLRPESSSMRCASDDLESPASENLFKRDTQQSYNIAEKSTPEIEEEKLLGETNTGFYSPASTTDQVKIKISKKQLQELLGRVGVNGLSIEQVLTRLMNVNSNRYDDQTDQQRSWRPALQSIAE